MPETDQLPTMHRGETITADYLNTVKRLLQRTVTGPNVIESAAGWHIRPMAAAKRLDWWLAGLHSGVALGEANEYPDVGGVLDGAYLDEVGPDDLQPFYPSRTRDSADVYIPTIGRNSIRPVLASGIYYQWPVPLYMGQRLTVWVLTGEEGGSAVHRFWLPISPMRAKVTDVNRGWPTVARWPQANLTATFTVYKSVIPPANYYAWPYAAADDYILLAAADNVADNAPGLYPVDITPRIPIKYVGTIGNNSDVTIDTAIPGLWTVDTKP